MRLSQKIKSFIVEHKREKPNESLDDLILRLYLKFDYEFAEHEEYVRGYFTNLNKPPKTKKKSPKKSKKKSSRIPQNKTVDMAKHLTQGPKKPLYYGRSEIMEINNETGLIMYEELRKHGITEKDALKILNLFSQEDKIIICLQPVQSLLSFIPKHLKSPKYLSILDKSFEQACLHQTQSNLLLLMLLSKYDRNIEKFKDWEVTPLRQRIYSKKEME